MNPDPNYHLSSIFSGNALTDAAPHQKRMDDGAKRMVDGVFTKFIGLPWPRRPSSKHGHTAFKSSKGIPFFKAKGKGRGKRRNQA